MFTTLVSLLQPAVGFHADVHQLRKDFAEKYRVFRLLSPLQYPCLFIHSLLCNYLTLSRQHASNVQFHRGHQCKGMSPAGY